MSLPDRDAADALARAVADTVSGHPSVARLDGGQWGAVATLLPGGRLVGVRVPDDPAGAIEVAVVLYLGTPIPAVAADLRARVAALTPRPVDLEVSDVLPPRTPATPAPPAAAVPGGEPA